MASQLEELRAYDPAIPNSSGVYQISIQNHTFQTILTSSPEVASTWTRSHTSASNGTFPVGLDAEWVPILTPNDRHPVAILQLAVEGSCLIFQLLHGPRSIPEDLRTFLTDPHNKFFGVGIHEDVEKLQRDYGIVVRNTENIESLAATKLGKPELVNDGLQKLAKKILRLDIAKHKRNSMSCWDSRLLSAEQLKYASIDAYVSFLLGRRLSEY